MAAVMVIEFADDPDRYPELVTGIQKFCSEHSLTPERGYIALHVAIEDMADRVLEIFESTKFERGKDA